MATPTSARIQDCGKWLELSETRFFLPGGPDVLWRVEQGALHLFLQSAAGGELAGARYHLLRIAPGEAVFSLWPEMNPPLAVVAAPSPETSVLEIGGPQLEEWLAAADGSGTEELARYLEQWIARLGAACSAVPPKRFTPLAPDGEAQTGEAAAVLAPPDGIVWMRHRRGCSYFLGNRELPAVNGAYFPVSNTGWLQAQAGSSLETASTATLLKSGALREALVSYHRTVLACFDFNRRSALERERALLQAKAFSDARSLHGALADFASSLDRERKGLLPHAAQPDPLLAACEAVGNALGIKIIAPPAGPDGAGPLLTVARIAKASSVRMREVVLRNEWWRQDGGPLVALRDSNNRPVALLPRSARGYDLYDPADGRRVPLTRSLASTLRGVAYSFYRGMPEQALSLAGLLKFALGFCRRDLSIVLAMGLAGGLLSLVPPIGIGIMFDSAIPGAQRGQVLVLTAFLMVSAVSGALFSLTRNFTVLRLQGKLDATLQSAAWDRLLRLPATFFRQYSSGDLAIRSLAFTEIRGILTGPVLSLVLSQMFSLLSFGLLFVYSWRLALLATLLIGITVAVSISFVWMHVKCVRQLALLRGRISGMVLELVNGIASFRISGAESRAFSVWARAMGKRKRYAKRAREIAAAMSVFGAGWPILCSAVVFYSASQLMEKGPGLGLSTGSFLAFFSAFNQFLMASLQFGSALLPILNVVPLWERMKPILEAVPEVDRAKRHPGELSGAIEVNHLTFRYRADAPLVLKDVSFSVRPGELLALVGSSGCGKSTLFRLLLGFEKPESGAIYFDGQDLEGLDIQAVRQQMGVVLQNGKLGSGSMLTLILGSLTLTIDDAWEAARMSGLDQDIRDLPMGMHTMISEGGGTLSGGQRQRLLIARAVVNRPRILLFDEATSALDNRTQAVVTRSLDSLRATRVVIAHRLSTILNADRILVLDKGSIVQSGTYQELMSQPGVFRELAVRQIV